MSIEEQIVKLYKEGNSTYKIAEIIGNGWYANKIRRYLKKVGVKLNDKSTAQKLVLESGRAKHPTEGTKRSQETKTKIGSSVTERWEHLSEEEKARRAAVSKQNWDAMSEAERENLRTASAKAIRAAADFGSKVEKFLLAKLRREGWGPEFHSTKRLPTEVLQLDIFIPEILTCIEIDGPSHWENVWGQEALQRTINSDNKKNALLAQNGYNVIRVRTKVNKVSNTYCNKVWNILKLELEKLKGNFRRNIEDRLIILEI